MAPDHGQWRRRQIASPRRARLQLEHCRVRCAGLIRQCAAVLAGMPGEPAACCRRLLGIEPILLAPAILDWEKLPPPAMPPRPPYETP